jgi:hypothetical protein
MDAARDILERGLQQAPVTDPYWEHYVVIRSAQAETVFETLRRETAP